MKIKYTDKRIVLYPENPIEVAYLNAVLGEDSVGRVTATKTHTNGNLSAVTIRKGVDRGDE